MTVKTPEQIADQFIDSPLTAAASEGDRASMVELLAATAREARKVDPTEQTPEQIAAQLVTKNWYAPLAGQSVADVLHENLSLTDGEGVHAMLTAAARAGIQTAWESWEPDDYAPVPEPEGDLLVVSTCDGAVRTGVTERTVAGLNEVIAGYIADGYTYEELVIEGVTR